METLKTCFSRSFFFIIIFTFFIFSPAHAERINYSPDPVYRIYNNSTHEHLLTTDKNEVVTLTGLGWIDEGIEFYTPDIDTGIKVYRLFNPNNSDHHYTTDINEYNNLNNIGWNGEGVVFYSSSNPINPVYRLFNSKLSQGSHLWTSDVNEYYSLPKIDPNWVPENDAFYAESLIEPNFTYEDQKLDLPSISNSRQLGGYTMSNGKKIKNNMLIRSGALNNLSDEDKQKLQNMNLKEVIDLRSDLEKESAEDILSDGANYNFIPAMDSMNIYDSETLKAIQDSMSSSDPNMRVITLAKYGGVKQLYKNILNAEQGKKAYRELFEVLLKNAQSENPGAVLWHCSQGKDRAGIASALILTALGADDATIRRDYSFTCQSYESQAETALSIAQQNNLTQEETTELLALEANAYPEYLQLTIESIQDEYGSLQGYLINALGLSQADLKTLQDAYLE